MRRLASKAHLVEQSWVTLDFLLKPDSLTRIEEGRYDLPFRRGAGQASIVPPGFRADDEPPGTSKLDCLQVEEVGGTEPHAPQDLVELEQVFPAGGAASEAEAAWEHLSPAERKRARAAAERLASLWPLTGAVERERVPRLGAWLAQRRFRADDEDLEVDLFGARRAALAAELGRPVAAAGGAA